MSGVTRQHSPAVYRRRRLAVFGGLLAVIAVVALIIWRPSLGGTPSASEEPAEETLVEEVIPVAQCSAGQIEVTAHTDDVRYAPGVVPQLWLSVRNVGSVECELEVGSDVQELVVDSGARDNPDVIWVSTHCQEGATPLTITLQPGQERSTTPITWDRTRSSPETCEGTRPQMPGGGASYHLSVKLGDFSSGETRQFILD